MNVNYVYNTGRRGLCSELNNLHGFYEDIINKDCRAYIDASSSQYFKIVSIYDVFKFPNVFIDAPQPNSTIVTGRPWIKAAQTGYTTKLTTQQCAELFCYTDKFQEKINKNIDKLSIPSKYNCFHIRRGDKVGEKKTGEIEAKKYNFKEYLTQSDRKIKTIFIMSDDHSCILEAQEHGYNIKTLTTKDQTGHSTHTDWDHDRSYLLDELIQFFSEIEIAKQSQQFIGTKSSNIFRYIKNQCVNDVEFISLD